MSRHAQQRRVLLIEDDVDLCEAISDVLDDHGHAVVSASDGADGLRRLREFRPDIIVLDLMMPNLDGWQFRVEQRRDPANAATPVVVISANHDAIAAAVDADVYLRKPVDAETLLHAVDGVLEARARRREVEDLAQSERLAAMGTLAAGLAHEINNPLTYVLLQIARASRLLTTLAPQPAVDDIDAALQSAREGAERIRGITSAIRVFTDRDALAVGPVDVRAPIRAALDIAMYAIRDRAVVTTSLAEPAFVTANEGQLAQVFLNLLTNAAQAIPEGDPDHHEIRVVVIPGDRVAIEISDTGEGIAPGLLGRVFEPFFTTKPVGQGTGLGLSISHGIVSAFAGTIAVTSAVGHGSTFRVELPASQGR